jgi:hypothetical protein
MLMFEQALAILKDGNAAFNTPMTWDPNKPEEWDATMLKIGFQPHGGRRLRVVELPQEVVARSRGRPRAFGEIARQAWGMDLGLSPRLVSRGLLEGNSLTTKQRPNGQGVTTC